MRGKIKDSQIISKIKINTVDTFCDLTDDMMCRYSSGIIDLVNKTIDYVKISSNTEQVVLPNITYVKECACTLECTDNSFSYSYYDLLIYNYNKDLTKELLVSKSYFVQSTFLSLTSIARYKNLSQSDINKLISRIDKLVSSTVEEIVDNFSFYLISFLQVVINKVINRDSDITEEILFVALDSFKSSTLDMMFN